MGLHLAGSQKDLLKAFGNLNKGTKLRKFPLSQKGRTKGALIKELIIKFLPLTFIKELVLKN